MDAAGTFLEKGILGAIIIVMAGVIALLFKLLMSEKNERLLDSVQNAAKYQTLMGEFSRNAELLLAKLSGKNGGQ